MKKLGDRMRALFKTNKGSPSSAQGLSARQSVICLGLLVVGATLKFLNYEPWFNFAGSLVGFCAILFMAVCLIRNRGA